MLYDYKSHIEKMKTSDACETLEEYAAHYGPQENTDIYDTVFYMEHLSKYDIPFRLSTPRGLKDSCNWDMFVRLMAASEISEITLSLDNEWTRDPTGLPLVHINVILSSECSVAHDIKDMSATLITRLHEIYVEEQMGNFSLIALMRKFYGIFPDSGKTEYDDWEFSLIEDQNQKLMKYKEMIGILMKEAGNVRKLHDILS